MFFGHIYEQIIILKTLTSYDLWIWHVLFWLPEPHRVSIVLDRSSVSIELTHMLVSTVNYSINGIKYKMEYYLVDDLVSILGSNCKKTLILHKKIRKKKIVVIQKQSKKDMKNAFGVLQLQFTIMSRHAHLTHQTLKDTMMTCIIL